MRNNLIARPNTLLDSFFNDDFFGRSYGSHLDVYHENGNIVVEADMPGFKKEEIELRFENDLLTLRAQHKEDNTDENKTYIYRSRSQSTFTRQIRLADIDPTKIDASFTDGVLKVVLAKKDPAKEEFKTIEIK